LERKNKFAMDMNLLNGMKNPIVMKTWNTSSKGHDIFECSFRFGCNQNKGRNSTSQNKKKERNKMREEVRENSNNTI
jgi:hypothetical protein